MAPGVEIERKFLVVAPPPGLERMPCSRIEQGYLALDPDGAAVRLRRQGGRTLMTIKAGHGLQRAEEEWRIDRDRFERLWPLTEGRRIVKRRYRLPAGDGLEIELDVYEGPLEGLYTAEVEAPTVEQAERFTPPAWMRLDVTDDRRYSNAALALHGAPARRAGGAHALLEDEDPTAGWRAVLIAQLDHAVAVLHGPGALPHDEGVHAARKALKRARALLRIARNGLDVERRTGLGDALRDAGRLLSGARDATVVLDTFDALTRRDPATSAGDAAAALRAVLAVRQASAELQAAGGGADLQRVLGLLEQSRRDAAGLDLGDDPAAVLAAGLQRIHRRGRKAWRAARDGEPHARTEPLHELRKRTKDLWHAAELLEPAAPKRLRRLAADAHDLADLLGADHDLAVLLEQVHAHAEDTGDAGAHEPLAQAIARRRAKLQRKALSAAERLYGEPITALAERTVRLGHG